MKHHNGGHESSSGTGHAGPASAISTSSTLDTKQRLLTAAFFFTETCLCLVGLAVLGFGVSWRVGWPRGVLPPSWNALQCYLILGLGWQYMLVLSGGYTPDLPRSLRLGARATLSALAVLIVWMLALSWGGVDRDALVHLAPFLGVWAAISYGLVVPAMRSAALHWLNRRGLRERVLIFVSPDSSAALLAELAAAYPLLVDTLEWAGDEGDSRGEDGSSVERALVLFILENHVDRILIASGVSRTAVRQIAEVALSTGISAGEVRGRGGAPAVEAGVCDLVSSPRTPGRLLAKEVCDVVGAFALLLLSWPILLLAAAAVRLSSPGPVFFHQERMGRRGRRFRMLKFRSMRLGADADHPALIASVEPGDILFKPERDPRVTRVGRILRRTSIDEIPQLLNILCGDMSLVGPRPMPTYETARLPLPTRLRRHAMKPGLTGLWQVSGRSNIRTLAERLDLDLRYVDHWSLALDMRILLQTVPAVLMARGAQ